MSTELGRRTHRIIGQFAGTVPTPKQVADAVNAMWLEAPYGGTTLRSARIQCLCDSRVYLVWSQPATPWVLTGVEVPFDGAVADLVWEHPDGSVVIDEVKTGEADPDHNDKLTDQLERLAAAGRTAYGDRFAGVRLVPIETPARIVLYRLDTQGALEVLDLPDELRMQRR